MADKELTENPSQKSKAKGVTAITKNARASAGRAARNAGNVFNNSPFSAVGGALALGAIIGAVLPSTRQEEEIIGPLGERVRASLDDALHAAHEAGTGELTAAGLTFAAATNGLGGVVGSLAKAAFTASGAAAMSVRKPRQTASNDSFDRSEPAGETDDLSNARAAE